MAMNLSGLGAAVDVGSSYAKADAAGANVLKRRAAKVEMEKTAKTAEIMKQYGAGTMTLEDAGNAMVGVDPKMGLDMQREDRSIKKDAALQRTKAFDDIKTAVKSVKSEAGYAELKRTYSEKYKDVEGFNVQQMLPPTWDDLTKVEGVWLEELEAVTTLGKQVELAKDLEHRLGAEHPRTVAAKVEQERLEDKAVTAAEAADLAIRKAKADLANEGKPKDKYKQRDFVLPDGSTQKQESYEDGAEGTWTNFGSPKAATGSTKANVTPTGITTKQLETATRIIESDPALSDVSNTDLMTDAIVSEANKRAKDSEEDYTTIMRNVISDMKETNITPGKKRRGAFGIDMFAADEPSTYEPTSFVTLQRAIDRGYPAQVNPSTGEKQAKVNGKWIQIIE